MRRRIPRTTDEANPLVGLNDEQKQVVTAHEGPYLVLAGAGSGKTRALVSRVAYLISHHDVEPHEILCVTFSVKAAREMNDRLHTLGVDTQTCRVGTWHSLALQILRDVRPEFRSWDIDATDKSRTLLKIVLGYQGMNWKRSDVSLVQSYIGLCKANLAEAGSDEAKQVANDFYDSNPCYQTDPSKLAEAYYRLTEEQIQRRLLTFDDMLLGAWKCLTTDEQARERWALRYRFVLQDEAQDCNYAQSQLAEILSEQHRNYMMVGDPSQSIYAFRGADPEILNRFEREWNPTIIRMNRNYRSGIEVVDAANNSTRSMPEGTHLGVDMIPERECPAKVEVLTSQDQDQEAELIVRNLLEAQADGLDWKDMAVLYRTNSQSRAIEETCLSNRIPYVVVGGTNFYDRKEIKDLLAYIRVAKGGSVNDFRRCVNTPFRFLGAAFLDKVTSERKGKEPWVDPLVRVADTGFRIQKRQRDSVEEFCEIIESIQESIKIRDEELKKGVELDHKHGPSAILERVIKATSFMAHITKDEGQETTENNRISNIRELIRSSERFATVDDLLEYIDINIRASKNSKQSKDSDRVTLSTIHKAKGLEWSFVSLIGMCEGIIPHRKAGDDLEERRIFYVGLTRAMDRLCVSHVRTTAQGDRVVHMNPSRFINESGLMRD